LTAVPWVKHKEKYVELRLTCAGYTVLLRERRVMETVIAY